MCPMWFKKNEKINHIGTIENNKKSHRSKPLFPNVPYVVQKE